ACAAELAPVVGSGNNGAGTCEALDGNYPDATAICLPSPPFHFPIACSKTVPCCSMSGAKQIIEDAFDNYRKCFIMGSFYTDYYLEGGLKPWATTLTNAFMLNATMKGMIIDASNLLRTMLDVQKQKVKTAKNYAPSEEICRFGTLSRGLAASDARTTNNQLVISQAGLSRSLGTMFSVGAAGRGDDNHNRLDSFITRFCDTSDSRNGLDNICNLWFVDLSYSYLTPPEPLDKNHNRDIDYTRSVDTKPTLNADFTDTNLKEDEASVLALGNYLYGHWQPKDRPSLSDIGESTGSIENYNEYRSVIARRAAAQNSFAAITAMRSAGSGSPVQYIENVLTRLGLTPAQIDRYAGGKTDSVSYISMNPQYSSSQTTDADGGKVATSYNGQMEILTRKIYQDPAFYANLMDTAANVKRTSAAMGGVGLMQDRDIYKSTTRSEMLLALLVELEARKVANNVHSARLK
ncbi:MAG: hypothetical protein AAB276_04135, partial [Pseudomonadota bacterium]